MRAVASVALVTYGCAACEVVDENIGMHSPCLVALTGDVPKKMPCRRLFRLHIKSNMISESDSSTEEQWSRHVVVHLPEHCFASAQEVGYLVKQRVLQHARRGAVHSEWGRRPRVHRGRLCLLQVRLYAPAPKQLHGLRRFADECDC